MVPGVAIFLFIVVSLIFVPLALVDKKNLFIRSAYTFAALLFALSLALVFHSIEFPTDSRSSGRASEVTLPRTFEIEPSMQRAVHGLGFWLVVLASGELLRLVLKRPAGIDLLGPSILFVAGVSLIEPHWAAWLVFATGLLSLAALALWGRKTPESSPAAPISSSPPAT